MSATLQDVAPMAPVGSQRKPPLVLTRAFCEQGAFHRR